MSYSRIDSSTEYLISLPEIVTISPQFLSARSNLQHCQISTRRTHRKYGRNNQGAFSVLETLNGGIGRRDGIGVAQDDLIIAEDYIVIAARG
jgi:hypothetical protein